MHDFMLAGEQAQGMTWNTPPSSDQPSTAVWSWPWTQATILCIVLSQWIYHQTQQLFCNNHLLCLNTYVAIHLGV